MITKSLKELITLTIQFMEGKCLSQPSLRFGICNEINSMCSNEIITLEEGKFVGDYIGDNRPNFWEENPDIDQWDKAFDFFFPCMEEGQEFIDLRIDYLKTLLEKL